MAVDWTPAIQLPAHPMDMRAAEHSEAGSTMGDLSRADGSYSVLLPGQRIDMSFPAYRRARIGRSPTRSRSGGFCMSGRPLPMLPRAERTSFPPRLDQTAWQW